MNDLYFVLRLRNSEAASIICGPVTGREAYASYAVASMDEDDGAVIVIPSNVTSDMLARLKVNV